MNENFLGKKNVKRVKDFLKYFDTRLNLIPLDTTAKTAKEAAKSLNVETGSIVKSLIFKSSKNIFLLCLISGDKLISFKKLSIIINDYVEKASAKEVKDKTGYSIGGVPPIAHLTPPSKVYIDINLNRFKNLYAAAGHPYVVFKISFENICKITKGEVIDIVE